MPMSDMQYLLNMFAPTGLTPGSFSPSVPVPQQYMTGQFAPQINIAPPANAPRLPAGAAQPMTPEDQALVSQGGWAGAANSVAPLMSDWRTTPAQALLAAVGGYKSGKYAAQQDLENRQLKREELAGMQAQRGMEQAKLQAALDQQAQLNAYIQQLPPEQQAAAMANPEAFFKAQMDAKQVKWAEGGSDATGRFLYNPQDPSQRISVSEPVTPKASRPMTAEERAAYKIPDGVPAVIKADGNPELLNTGGTGVKAVIDPKTGQPVYVPESQAPGMTPADQRNNSPFENSDKLKRAFEDLTKDHRAVTVNYGKIDEGFKQNSKSGDVAALYGYMKLLDPTSVVRESEFETAATAGGVPQRIASLFASLTGQGRLTPAQRAEIRQAALSQIAPYRKSYEEIANNYRGLAKNFELNPDNIVTKLTWPDAAAPVTSAPNPTAQGGDHPPPPPGFTVQD